MKNFRFLFARRVCGFFVVAMSFSFMTIAASPRVAAAFTLMGEWTAELSTKYPDRVQLSFSFSRRSEKGEYNNTMGHSFQLSELQGLSADSRAAGKTDVRFSLVREAGTLACEGFFRDGRGAGTWTFTANSAFASDLKSRGYANLAEED